MSVASAWITVYAQHKDGAIGSTVLLPLNWRIENALYSYLDYIRKETWLETAAFLDFKIAGWQRSDLANSFRQGDDLLVPDILTQET